LKCLKFATGNSKAIIAVVEKNTKGKLIVDKRRIRKQDELESLSLIKMSKEEQSIVKKRSIELKN
jgi:hypothetical protein